MCKFLNFATVLCLLIVVVLGRPQQQQQEQNLSGTTTEPSTWEKIKKGVEHGWNVVYDEGHCAFHKVKELVKSHDHDDGSDPCLNKPYQQNTTTTTPKSFILVAEERVPVNAINSTPRQQ